MSPLTREIIRIEGLSYTYPQSDEPALKGVNLSIREGEIVTLMGHTGCGKSTLCLTLNGIIPHALGGELEGTVIVD
ncbi:MAG: ATP-binding cassette domain-containing protein, partial [Candidatus Korarchaeota archaeon]|nr:ATP-binding cassette domain-containing protein [Candidatus Korarchaeota archaeon]